MTKKTINEAPEKLLPGQKEIADKILRKDLEDNRKRRLDNEQAGVPAALRRAMEARREKKNDNSLTTDKDFNTSSEKSHEMEDPTKRTDFGTPWKPTNAWRPPKQNVRGTVPNKHGISPKVEKPQQAYPGKWYVGEATDPGKMKMANKRLLTSTAQVPETESPKKRPTSTKAKNAATKFVDSAKRNRKLVLGQKPHEISNDPELKSRSGQ